MNHLMQKVKRFAAMPPGVIKNDAAFVCNVIDTQGLSCLTIDIILGATDIAMAALKVQEAEVAASATALTSGTDIPLADFSVSPATLPSATADNTVVTVTIPITGGRKRYILLVATAGNGAAGTYAAAIAYGEAIEVPNTAALRGVGQNLIVPG